MACLTIIKRCWTHRGHGSWFIKVWANVVHGIRREQRDGTSAECRSLLLLYSERHKNSWQHCQVLPMEMPLSHSIIERPWNKGSAGVYGLKKNSPRSLHLQRQVLRISKTSINWQTYTKKQLEIRHRTSHIQGWRQRRSNLQGWWGAMDCDG